MWQIESSRRILQDKIQNNVFKVKREETDEYLWGGGPYDNKRDEDFEPSYTSLKIRNTPVKFKMNTERILKSSIYKG